MAGSKVDSKVALWAENLADLLVGLRVGLWAETLVGMKADLTVD